MIELGWMTEDRDVFLWRISAAWSWPDIADAVRQAEPLTRLRGHYVTLIDFSDADPAPADAIGALPLLTPAFQSRQHWPARVLVVQASTIVEALLDIVAEVYRLHITYHDSRAEALASILEPD